MPWGEAALLCLPHRRSFIALLLVMKAGPWTISAYSRLISDSLLFSCFSNNQAKKINKANFLICSSNIVENINAPTETQSRSIITKTLLQI